MFEAMRRLHPRGAANKGICVDHDGAMLGPVCVLVARTPTGFQGIGREDASIIQKSVLDSEHDTDWLFRQSQRITDALNKGELALAQIYGLRIPVGRFNDQLLKRLAAESLAKWSFNPDEPRIPKGDPHGGEWTTGDGNGGGSVGEDSAGGDSDGPDDGAPFIPDPEALLADFFGADSGESGLEQDAPPPAGASPASEATSGSASATSSDAPPIKWEIAPLGDTASGGSPNDGASDSSQVPSAVAGFVGEAPSWLAGDLTPATEDALKLLFRELGGATAFFGTLFLPTNNSPVTEGQIAGIAGLSYRYDGDTGVLQLLQSVGSLGSVVVDQGHIGLDGLFRDAAGNVVGRFVSGSGVVIDVGALPGFRDRSETDKDQPRLCPDPNAEDMTRRSERSLAYQEQVSGLPRGFEVTLNGVRFDGCIEEDITMLEAKGEGYAYLLQYAKPAESITADFLRQARAQVAAAAGLWSVEWHFAERGAADFARALFRDENLPIKVVYEPWRKSIH